MLLRTPVAVRRRGRNWTFVLTALFVMALSGAISATAFANPQIDEIRADYQICRALRTSEVGMRRMYGIYTDLQNQERAEWHAAPPDQGTVLEEMVLYGSGERPRFAELSVTSPSQDWSKGSEYCYRADGTLSFVFSILRTTYGSVRVEDRFYYNGAGKRIRTIRRIFDLDSGKRLPDGTDDFTDRKTDVFVSTAVLMDMLINGQSAEKAPDDQPQSADAAEPAAAPQSSPSVQSANAEVVRQLASDVLPLLEALLDGQFVTAARQHFAASPGKGGEAQLGAIMLMQRHLPQAAWLFALDAINRPGSVAIQNNLGVLLQEVAASTEGTQPANAKFMQTGLDLLRSARGAAPGNAIVNSNLGQAITNQWQRDETSVQLKDAVEALQNSIRADPNNPFARAHLAQALAATGDINGAKNAFNEAHRRWSGHTAVMFAGHKFPDVTGTNGSAMPQCEGLDVAALCQKMCPCTSIIGCLDFVACNIDNSGHTSACRAGKPIPASFNCATKFPEYGIMLPGLQNGFSIIGPGFKFHAGTDGKGGIKWEIEAGPRFSFMNAYVKAQGSIDPSTGAMSGVNVNTGLKFTLGPSSPGSLGGLLDEYGIHPGAISFEDAGDKPVKIEAWEDMKGFFVQN